ncbi:MAG TPA: ParB/RepB/Spo0J family partition protein [Acidimicrobiales bacterium]|nr:ParB/RepB/Spo0J family partition protein [Acidimicrobiales bacterium]
MARRGGLGRGLGALIPPGATETPGVGFAELPVSAITANRRQPRTTFDEEALNALTASVREVGVLQPVLVRATGPDTYELVAGERRWRAAKRAGLQMIPALVRSADDAASLEQALVENLQREDLNPMDEAAAYQQLIEDFGLTHDEVAARVGRSRAAVTNTLRLFQLPPSVQRLVAESKLSAGHARALLASPDRSFQEALARRAAGEGLSVRAVEEAVRRRDDSDGAASTGRGPTTHSGGAPTTGAHLRPPGLLELEELLSAHLETRVKVQLSGGRGRMVVEFADLADLERIYRAMTGPPEHPS